MTKTKDFENYKDDSLVLPRDEAWDNWKSWKDAKVGEKVQGYIRDAFFRAAEGVYGAQRGITLEQTDGTLINVGIKDLDFVLKHTDGLRVGDPLTIELDEVQDPKTAGQYGAKIYKYYGKNLPENAKLGVCASS